MTHDELLKKYPLEKFIHKVGVTNYKGFQDRLHHWQCF